MTTIDDIIWYCESGTKPNALVRFDPKTQKFQTWVVPSGGGVIRNMMPADHGHQIAIAESGINKVGFVTIH